MLVGFFRLPLANARALAIRYHVLPYTRHLLADDPTPYVVRRPLPVPKSIVTSSATGLEDSEADFDEVMSDISLDSEPLGLEIERELEFADPYDDVVRVNRAEMEEARQGSAREFAGGWVKLGLGLAVANRGRIGKAI